MKKLFILLLFISFNSFGQAEKEPKEMNITRPDTINIKEMSVIVIPKVSHTPLGGDGIIKGTNKKKIEMTPFEFIIDKWKPKKKLFLRLKKLILEDLRH